MSMGNFPLFSKGGHEYISYAGYDVFILKRHSVFLISVGNFPLFSIGQYFSYRWVIFLYSQGALSISHIGG